MVSLSVKHRLLEEQVSQQQAIYHQITHLAVRLLYLVSGGDHDPPVSQVIIRCILEASGGDSLRPPMSKHLLTVE